jgi:3-hydroxymyristoyl/3-hydroxydecanoyl-(acyl carrier protein) dehydratase
VSGLPFARPLPGYDRIDVYAPGERPRIVARKRVSADNPYMRGHFPGLTMYPATFLLEGVRQAVALVDEHAEVTRVRSVRVLQPMLGGTELLLRIDLSDPDEAGRFEAGTTCSRADDVVVARLTVEFGPGDGHAA